MSGKSEDKLESTNRAPGEFHLHGCYLSQRTPSQPLKNHGTQKLHSGNAHKQICRLYNVSNGAWLKCDETRFWNQTAWVQIPIHLLKNDFRERYLLCVLIFS